MAIKAPQDTTKRAPRKPAAKRASRSKKAGKTAAADAAVLKQERIDLPFAAIKETQVFDVSDDGREIAEAEASPSSGKEPIALHGRAAKDEICGGQNGGNASPIFEPAEAGPRGGTKMEPVDAQVPEHIITRPEQAAPVQAAEAAAATTPSTAIRV